MRKVLVETAGWYGMLAIVGAYALVSFEVLDNDSAVYQLLNLTGAMGISLISWSKRAVQPTALNVIWTLIAAVALIRML